MERDCIIEKKRTSWRRVLHYEDYMIEKDYIFGKYISSSKRILHHRKQYFFITMRDISSWGGVLHHGEGHYIMESDIISWESTLSHGEGHYIMWRGHHTCPNHEYLETSHKSAGLLTCAIYKFHKCDMHLSQVPHVTFIIPYLVLHVM